MNEQIDIKELIKNSTIETFKSNLKNIVEKNVPINERLKLYNYIATDVYSQGYQNYGVDGWELGLEYLEVKEIDNILKADFLKTYGLVWMELNQFKISIKYLIEAMDILDNSDDGILIEIYFGLSIVYKYLTDISKAIEYSQKATQIAKKMNDNFEISRAYLNTGNLLSTINKNSEAEKAYLNALKYSNNNNTMESNIFMSLGVLYKNKLEYKRAEEMYNKAEKLFMEMQFINEVFELYINYGTLYTKQAQFDKGEDYLQIALKYFERIKDSYNMATCYLNLARLEQDRARFSQSLNYFNQVIELFQRDKNLISLASLVFFSRGNLFQDWKEMEKACDDYQTALEYAKEQSDEAMEASIKSGLAGIEASRGNIDEAERIYQNIIVVFKKDNNIEEVVGTYINIALLYDKRGKYQLAQKAYEKALEFTENIDMPKLKISVLINLAELLGTVAHTEKAIELYNEALEMLSFYDNDDLLSKCYLNLANIYESITEFKKAIKYGELALNLKKKLKQEKSLYIVYNALAISYDGLEDIQEAERYYQKTLLEAKKQNISHYYGMLVNYGLFLFKFKHDSQGAIECYDEAKNYFEKHQSKETLIAINSNYAMIFKAQSENNKAITHYKEALKYADMFLSFMEDETMMMKYRINFEHIYENLIELYISQKSYTEAFYYLEGLKSRTFSKILSSKYFESNTIPIELLNKERELKKELEQILNGDAEIVKLNDIVNELYNKIKEVYSEMKRFDDRYVLLKENTPLGSIGIKKLL